MRALTPQDAETQVNAGAAVLIDIRSEQEFAAAHLPGAFHLLPETVDADVARMLGDRDPIFYCTSGMRTKTQAEKLSKAGFANPALLDGGLNAWRAASLPVKTLSTEAGPLPIQRQVQITVAVFLLVLTALSVWVSPLFVIGVGAIGLGLGFAGLTGSCALAQALMLMPWNRVTPSNA